MFLWCKIMKCILYITLCCLWYLLYQEELRLHLYLRGQSTIQNMTKMLQKNSIYFRFRTIYQYAEFFCRGNFAQAGTWISNPMQNLTLNFKLNLPAMYRTINHTFWRKRWSILSTVYERSYVFSAARLGFRIWHWVARACMYHRSIAWFYFSRKTIVLIMHPTVAIQSIHEGKVL